jgi:predicted metal-dependent peptidase
MKAVTAAGRKLAAARARLVLERPFLGSLVMHLALEAVDVSWCPTFTTDGRTFFFKPAYVDGLDFGEAQFVLAHEALHCALGHFVRRMHRTHQRWDAATDYAVNTLLVEEGLKAPRGALLDARFTGMSAEEIYRLLPSDCEQAPLDRHIADAPNLASVRGLQPPAPAAAHDPARNAARTLTPHTDAWDDAGNETRASSTAETPPPLLLPDDREQLGVQWQSRVAVAEQHARHAGRLAASWARLVREAVRPQLPWRVLLSRYMTALARNDFSFRRPSRREGAAVLPSLASEDIDIVVAIDTSGSLTDADLAEFAAEMNAMKGELHGRVTLIACDEAIDERAPWRFEPWEPLRMPPELRGGGGTSFVPVFEWIDRAQVRADVLVYFTDAEGEFPAAAPHYPVLWLVKGRGAVPWGDRIQLD